ncbi:MAG: DUF1501 domain-containing protein [Ilumatobacteraceae bacterium]
MPMDRRTFLLSGASAGVLFGLRPHVASAAGGGAIAGSAPAVAGDPRLVVVTLHGGNDALNTVVPIDDPAYAAARGALAVDPEAAHDLGDGYALHPALAGGKALWDAGQLAVVHGVGFPSLDRSHFHCMDVWQAGDEEELGTGWLGRWLDEVSDDPLDAVAVGRRLPLALRGSRRSAAVVPVGPFVLPGDDALRRSITAISRPERGRPPLAALVASSTNDLLSVVDTVGPLVAPGPTMGAGDEEGGAAGGTASADSGGLAGQLAVVADLIEADVPTRVFGVELGGFDTHANQAGTHAALLTELDGALASFVTRMGGRPVTVVVFSEFGRRVKTNGSAGTDHGGAGTVLLAGHVRPGSHGDPPPLDRLDGGDLATTVDFRSVYGGLLEGVLGVDAADVLAAAPRPLALVP